MKELKDLLRLDILAEIEKKEFVEFKLANAVIIIFKKGPLNCRSHSDQLGLRVTLE